MALYAETGCHVAKRPRVEFAPQTAQQQIHAHATAAAAQQAAAVQAAAALQLAAATASVPAVSAAAGVPTGAQPAGAVPQQNLSQNHSNNVTLTPAGHGATVTTPSSSVAGGGGVGCGGGGGGGILSQHYIEQQLNRKSHEPEKPNHILLFTVLNPTYPT